MNVQALLLTKRRALVRVAAGAVAFVLLCVMYWPTLLDHLIPLSPSLLLLDRRDAMLGELPAGPAGDTFGYWPLPAGLPPRVVAATLAIEDRHFYEHTGVDWRAVGRAMLQNARALRVVSGASTLAMQVARMQRGRSRGPVAKVSEALEARALIKNAGHDAVLRQYLRMAPYGNRMHGAVRAARYYFNKPVEDLSWLQAAYLAALPQAPARMNPYDTKGRAAGTRRAHRILKLLHTSGFLTDRDLEQALASDLGIVPRAERPREAIHATLAFAEQARAAARAHNQEPTVVRTTLDLDVQKMAVAALAKNLVQTRGRGATNTAGLVVDSSTGDILAYVGSADYFDVDARGAIDFIQQRRSPGSALKPFIYAAALDGGKFTAASLLPDTPMELVSENGASYVPRNISRTFLGPMLFREALANSRNIPALRVLAQTGVEPVLGLLERGGVHNISYAPDQYGLGLALGNLAVTPLELAGLYLALANDGVAVRPRFILPEATADPDAPAHLARLFSPEAAHIIRDVLADKDARQPSFPEGSALEYAYAVAVKTGTSQGYRDGWTAAFSDRAVVVAWIGNHDWRRMDHLGGLAGTAGAVHEILDALMRTHEPQTAVAGAFAQDASLATRTVCTLSGELAGPHCPHARGELFIEGTEPHTTCETHARVRIDKRNGLLATASCPTGVVQERVMVRVKDADARFWRGQHKEIAPTELSPLCGGAPANLDAPSVALVEPQHALHLAFDPDTPPELSTIRVAADVKPVSEDVVFLVDGQPFATVGYPHEAHWSVTPGQHRIQAALAHHPERSNVITVDVRN